MTLETVAPRSQPSQLPVVCSWIAGTWRETGQVREHLNPARPGVAVARVVSGTRDLVIEARACAQQASLAWRRESAQERGDVLRRAAAKIRECAADLAMAVASEEGKTLAEARGEAERSAQIFEYFAGQVAYEPDGATFAPAATPDLLFARRVPVGVVAAITPWNFPLAIPAWKLAPALGYGNAVLWKPADLVPLSSRMLMEAVLAAGVPTGVLQLIVGSGRELGPELVGVPGVDAVTFTGSTEVGRSLMLAAATTGQRLQLELGGKNAAIVLQDADLDNAVEMVARGAFLSAGQKCTATSRVIVEDPIYDEFVSRFVARADAMTVGDPVQPGSDIGPLSSEANAQAVRNAIATGEKEGRRLTLRDPEDVPDGAFVAPVVLADLVPDSDLVRNEIFGPVAIVIRAADADDALRIANDSPFGLTAGVHTRSLTQALRFSEELRVGMVKINQETPGNAVHVPFGGTGASGFGPNEQGKAAVEFFTKWKTTYLNQI